ncbi:unnamed protein product [Rotaria sordida]|uniref:Uncharacterized protein n=1 Tax=Rotaria sordida TaxID=392033 RepID=A0A815NEE4_9BILA|nr:unnamed protein product [Rotaria sordida]CAF1438356.1 unnamed protein product [Rotaria sordida]
MSVIHYSASRIQFKSNNRSTDDHNYSDRSLVEIRAYDNNEFSLRALDINNNNRKIFNFPLKRPDLYRFGNAINEPHETDSNTGTYRLWLNGESYDKFHETYRTVIEMLFPNQSIALKRKH